MNNFNILIIEDEVIIALGIKRSLERHGFNVIGIARDSVMTLGYIQKNRVDLIIADITIAGELNGIETVALIQKSFDIPAFFLTSHHEDRFLTQAARVNFTGYLVKPYLEEALIREVKLVYFRSRHNSAAGTSVELGGGYRYYTEDKCLHAPEGAVALTNSEKFFLHILIMNKNQVVSLEQLDALIWNDKPVDFGNRRQLLFRLRKKVPELVIETIKGEGYKLVVEPL